MAAVGAVTNVNFLLRSAVGSDLARGSTGISGLSATGQPGARLFRTGDLLFGAATTVLAVGVHRSRPGAPRTAADRWLAAGLAVCGLGNIGAAAVAERTATTRDVGDALSSVPDAIHGLASLVAGLGLVVAVGAAAVRTARTTDVSTDGRATDRRLARPATVLAVAITGLSVTEAVGLLDGGIPWSGWVQRLQVALTSVWLMLIGILLSPSRPAGPPAGRPPARPFAAGRVPKLRW